MTRYICALVLVVVAQSALADPRTFSCPRPVKFVDTDEGKLERGWEVIATRAPRELSQISVFDGHPSEQASLKPDEEPEAPAYRAKWQFPAGTKNIWLACHYRGVDAILARRLPEGMKQCTAAYRGSGSEIEATGQLVCE